MDELKDRIRDTLDGAASEAGHDSMTSFVGQQPDEALRVIRDDVFDGDKAKTVDGLVEVMLGQSVETEQLPE